MVTVEFFMVVGGLCAFLCSNGNHDAIIAGIFFFSVGCAMMLGALGGIGGVLFALSYLFLFLSLCFTGNIIRFL
ncbi:MAG: hypothetical protein E7440_02840 [Ruminococcaceae bacterium]|nr:hypothetical protein [Oscillospiraceae bacterium]